MLWKEYLPKIASSLAEYLKKDIQYCSIPKSGIRQIAWQEIELFIEYLKKWSPEKLILNESKKISPTDQNRLAGFLNKRQKGVPLAYITGKQQFYGLEFEVNKHTLIPRPETEELVEHLLYYVGAGFKSTPTKSENIVLIDIGTGSGCILTAILKNLPKNIKLSEIYAVDKSSNALSIAKKNLKTHLGDKYKIDFISKPLLAGLPCRGGFETRPYIKRYVITANLPYLSEKEYKALSPEVRKYEPKSALVGGKEGHELICQLIDQIQAKKISFDLFLEISPTIYPKIKKHCALRRTVQGCACYSPVLKIKKYQDLSSKIRILHLSC